MCGVGAAWMVVLVLRGGCAFAWCWWVDRLRDGSMLVRCWVSGAALVCPWALLFTGVHCCVFRWWGGVVLCENCIVDASIFLFLCFGVICLDCLCVRVFCYGRMVDALAC